MLGTLNDRLHRMSQVARRATLAPLLVRAGVFLCALLGFVVAYPTPVVASQLVLPLLVVAITPALLPRGRAATVAAVLIVAGWVLDTSWYAERISLWRVVVLATVLYLGHTLTALAAVLPYDATVHLDVVTGWLARAFAVVLVSAVFTVVVLSLARRASGDPFVVASLVGLAAAACVAVLLSRLLRRA